MPATLQLDAKTIAAIAELPLLAQTVVEGFLDGLHRSPFLGYSSEFSAYRAYAPGDNIRHIDWKVWARTDQLYVKQFEDDTNMRCQIFLDVSGSMNFGEGDTNKFNYSRILAAVLAQLMVKQRDAPGLILFGANARLGLPALATRHQAQAIFELLAQTDANGTTAVGHDLLGIIHTFTRRGLAVVVSDFLMAGEAARQLLRQLHGQNQEVVVFQVLCPEELTLPYDGEWLMEDSETGEEIVVHADDLRESYLEKLKAHTAEIRRECLTLEIDFQSIRTDEPLDKAMTRYLERRMAI